VTKRTVEHAASVVPVVPVEQAAAVVVVVVMTACVMHKHAKSTCQEGKSHEWTLT
jgi:hypothetical protein